MKRIILAAIAAIVCTIISHATAYAASDGATLYAQYCSGCHGATPSGARVGATASTITNAIATISDMKSNSALKTLTTAQIQAIADFLGGGASTTDSGSTLFLSYCISCHNTVPTTDPRLVGATASKITNAISSITQMKSNSSLAALTSTQTQAISDFITSSGKSSNWTIVGVGDFNADNNTDILWRDTVNGYNVAWLMNGTTYQGVMSLPTLAGNSWLVEGVGDFNQDGYADILWRNVSTGENVIWLMNGAAVKSYVSLPTLSDRNWTVAAIGDFNGDGKPDILLRHLVYGYNVIWYLNGTSYSSYDILPQLSDQSWVVGGAADMDKDGHTDLVWRNKTSGYNAIWDLSGTSIANSYLLSPQVSDTSWSIAAVARPDSNGYVNIFWRNQVSGSNAVWTMNGTNVLNYETLTTVAP
ncbi:MAG: FG-GAP-like repeat-containing protein [Candidatus Magnetominusculus sp. LBB02]|nr:FG-GAP-like repeat-containing protein [Candidatus Magnetominusculus sp. LBB02]